MQANPATYQVAVPEGVAPGAMFQANVGGQMMQVQCPAGVGPGQMIQVQGAAMAVAAPAVQLMNNDADGGLDRIMSPLKGLLIRQRLDAWEGIVPFFNKENKYKVAAKPDSFDDMPYADMTDEVFKAAMHKGHVLTMKEKSEFCDRIVCLNRRTFDMRVKPGKATEGMNWEEKNMLSFHRPCKLNVRTPCCLLCPNEITAHDNNYNVIGKVQEDFRCPGSCCMKRYWNLTDKDDQLKYVLVDDLCCNTNICAPTFCCPVRRFDLMDPTVTERVGGLRNIFPGCTMRGCWGDADNYVVDFPADATSADKATILAASILIDFQLFEKSSNDEDGGF